MQVILQVIRNLDWIAHAALTPAMGCGASMPKLDEFLAAVPAPASGYCLLSVSRERESRPETLARSLHALSLIHISEPTRPY